MNFGGFVLNVVCCAIIETIAGILLPEGRMKSFTMSTLGLFLFFSIVYPFISYIFGGGFDDLIVNL